MNTKLVLIFNDLNKAQFYRKPYGKSPHNEVEILISFNYLNLFKPYEHTEDYHIRKPNKIIFLFATDIKKCIYVREKVNIF